MSSTILLVSSEDAFSQALIKKAKKYRPDTQWVLPNDERARLARVAACWFPDDNLLTGFPNIKCIHALSAGVEHLGSPLLHSGLPICRIVDENQQQGMFEYVLWGVLFAHRHFDRAVENHAIRHFQRYSQRPARHIRVSILGLGMLGKYVASSLAKMGYSVSGWSTSPKNIDQVQCFAGSDSLNGMLEQTDILVNLLPLSPATQHILSQSVFDVLPQGGYLINCGRGGHVKEDDLIHAVQSGHLRGAMLDVFEQEPLPSSNPLWHTKGILVTPHMASEASLSVVVNQVSDNAQRFLANKALCNCIDTNKGY